MPWYAIVMIVVLALSSGAMLGTIGKPRDPLSPGIALATLVANCLFICGIVWLAS